MSGTSSPKKQQIPTESKDVKLQWSETTEQLLVGWADIATCYKWLHDQSYRMFEKKNFSFSIPIIILSTVTGTLSVGMNSIVPEEWVHTAQIAVGGINIFTGIISTLQNFFHYAQLSEAHLNAGIGWSKLQRNIAIELSVDRKFRKDADTFIRVCRADYDRLLEQSPTVPDKIINLFKTTFKKNKELIRPDICDHLQHLTVYVEKASSELGVTTDDSGLFSPRVGIGVGSPFDDKVDEADFTPTVKSSTGSQPQNNLPPPPIIFPNGYRRASVYYKRRASAPNIQPLVSDDAPKPIQIEREAPSVKDLIRRFTIDDGKPKLLRALPPDLPNAVESEPSMTCDIPTPRADEIELEEIKIIDDLLTDTTEPATPVADEGPSTSFKGRPKPKRKHTNFKKFDFKMDIKTDDEM
jgi:hypothetical protein